MREFSAFAAATVIAAGLVTTVSGVASAAGPCPDNAVVGVQVKDVRGTSWICRGPGGNYKKTGSRSVTACWIIDKKYRVQLYKGDKKVSCPTGTKEVKNEDWTGFKVIKA